MGTKYIHYGSNAYDPDKFEEPINQPHFNKPDGGLWASPVDTDCGWKQFCESNNFSSGPMDQWFTFELDPAANVYEIQCKADVDRMPHKKHDWMIREIDFEDMLLDGWDAVLFHANQETKIALWGWDCDSLLVLNRNVII